MSGTPVVVLGAGGHARVCLDLLLENDDLEVVGCVGTADGGSLQRPLLGDDEQLPRLREQGVTHAFVAVGANSVRQRLTGDIRRLGFTPVQAVSRAATVSSTATVGDGVAVMAGAVVNAYASLGTGAIVNTGATIDHDCRIGDFAHVAPGVHLAGTCEVGEGSLIGVGATARPNTRVGRWALVGAGAVLVAEVPHGVTVLGNPARIVADAP